MLNQLAIHCTFSGQIRQFVGLLAIFGSLWLFPSSLGGQQPRQSMELPPEIRAWYRNPDGSCVQCSIGMCGVWANVPAASTLLWRTDYGPAERGGSWPSRVADYCRERGIAAFNVTGSSTFQWMEWSARTGRFAAIGAGRNHFQTEYGRDGQDGRDGRWYVCDNNSTERIDEYSDEAFRRLHLASGPWVVILDTPSPPAVPEYVPW
jgi:hypothetical protein